MPVQVYIKLTPSDQSYVPFNAQKHYLVETSESAASASINFFTQTIPQNLILYIVQVLIYFLLQEVILLILLNIIK